MLLEFLHPAVQQGERHMEGADDVPLPELIVAADVQGKGILVIDQAHGGRRTDFAETEQSSLAEIHEQQAKDYNERQEQVPVAQDEGAEIFHGAVSALRPLVKSA